MKNILTIDLEDWYHTNGLNIPPHMWPYYESRIERNTDKLLELLSIYQVKATFFVLGAVAQTHPFLVRRIHGAGHEIGSHGMRHQLLYHHDLDYFKADIIESKSVIEDLIGEPVTAYRAPSWSIPKPYYDYWNTLSSCGFTIDSSIQPFATPLSGDSRAPLAPFHPVLNGQPLDILEYPSTVWDMNGIRIPFAGGLYFRLLPYSVSSYALKKVNELDRGMIYLHPWEIDFLTPKVHVPPHIKFAQYYNLHTMEKKLTKLIREFSFTTLGNVVRQEQFPKVSLVV